MVLARATTATIMGVPLSMSHQHVFSSLLTAVSLISRSSLVTANAPECKRFDEIYTDGKDLCETMWDNSFKYETNEANAYTMWFFDQVNPNDAVSRSLGKLPAGQDHAQCHLSYYHKEEPSPEPDTFTECLPWKDSSCCHEETVESANKLREGYGAEYHWDRCGPLTPECERFFVQEACFYECDPNAGLFRKFPHTTFDANDPDHNEWQMWQMPIKASYCDAWFNACRGDKFCAHDGGSYFSCAAVYENLDNSVATVVVKDDVWPLETVVLLAALGVLVVACCVGTSILILREKSGNPIFGRLKEQKSDKTDANVVGFRM